jgi:STIP1 family protein 1
MEQWEAVIADCEKAIDLLPTSCMPPAFSHLSGNFNPQNSVKAFTYLGQAHLHLNRPTESFSASKTAYALAIQQRSPSIPSIAATCLAAKKARWEQLETLRIERESRLLRELCDLLDKQAQGRGGGEDEVEEARKKKREVESVFGKAEAERLRRRDVPDWLIDNITFGIMFDPVMVSSLPPPFAFV